MRSNKEYIKEREKLIDRAIRETLKYSKTIDDNYNKDLFNRMFLNIMDKLCYETGISKLKPRIMSHEKDFIPLTPIKPWKTGE